MSYIFSKYKRKLVAIVLLGKYYSCKKENNTQTSEDLSSFALLNFELPYSDCESPFISFLQY